MIYKLKIYTNYSRRPIVVDCGEDFFNNFKEDLNNIESQYLNLESLIIVKSTITHIDIKEITDKQ